MLSQSSLSKQTESNGYAKQLREMSMTDTDFRIDIGTITNKDKAHYSICTGKPLHGSHKILPRFPIRWASRNSEVNRPC
ncbi:hypothetical protein AYI69_g6870 [Smittium culicis]|uniref:Uncharacterized protein n=1 Tax=Smittium culicis TaxID=133412 RepID=A0A1R1XW16_9FUNG|nr:hypothetical protein AYI69_g6870 [Smittium culicis]